MPQRIRFIAHGMVLVNLHSLNRQTVHGRIRNVDGPVVPVWTSVVVLPRVCVYVPQSPTYYQPLQEARHQRSTISLPARRGATHTGRRMATAALSCAWKRSLSHPDIHLCISSVQQKYDQRDEVMQYYIDVAKDVGYVNYFFNGPVAGLNVWEPQLIKQVMVMNKG